MIWTYRVFRDPDGYCVRVVNYDREGKLLGYNLEPSVPTGRTAEELAQDIQWFKEAFDLPILTTQELDTDLALRKPNHRPQSSKGKSIEELMATLENATEKEMVAAD